MPSEDLTRAAALLRAGRLVAFPTETVYGLGANALDPAAVRRIFEVKGRPSTSPLIVHVNSPAMARLYVTEWPEAAGLLAARWWPGPLTLVLPKAAAIPDIATAGLATVGLRVPAHPLALELIGAAGIPVAAPSANRFGQLSPVTAEHVRAALGAEVDMVLDGGPATVGIESTVLSLAGRSPALLRPGVIRLSEIEALIGPVAAAPVPAGAHASPGMHSSHYKPATRLVLAREGVLPLAGRGAYLWLTGPAAGATSIAMPREAPDYAAALYGVLHDLDREGLDWIAVEAPPETEEWAGVLDRLKRAASVQPAAETRTTSPLND